MARADEAPHPAQLTHLRPTDAAGLRVVGVAAGARRWIPPVSRRWLRSVDLRTACCWRWRSSSGSSLLHECGHDTLFRTRRWHAIVGHVAGVLLAHPVSHAGSGSTAAITSGPAGRTSIRRRQRSCRARGRASSAPSSTSAGAAGFRSSRSSTASTTSGTCRGCFRLFPAPRPSGCASSRDAAILRRAVCGGRVGSSVRRRCCATVGPALRPQPDRRRRPAPQPAHAHPAAREPRRSRSGRSRRSSRKPSRGRCGCRAWLSTLLLHFDAHELHHMYPFVPGYHLRRHRLHAGRTRVGWWRWMRGASGCPARCCSSRTGTSRDGTICDRSATRVACALFLLRRSRSPAWRRRRGSRRRCRAASRVPLDGGARSRGRRMFGEQQDAARLRRDGAGDGRVASRCSPRSPAIRPARRALAAVARRLRAGSARGPGSGFMAGELPNSFVKRQLGIAPGDAPRGRSRRVRSSSPIGSTRASACCSR